MENQAVFPLFQYIQNNTPLIISSDGSKGERRSGGSWIIAFECGTHIVKGHTPNFGQISAINSYRAEVYAFLAATLFLHLYSVYYKCTVHNKIHALCDNQAYVNKLTWFLEDEYHQQGHHKNTEAEALSIILQLLPSNFTNEHVKGHQDDKINYNDLDVKAQLNIDADSIATATATITINTHAISLPFAIYINNKYIHHHPDHSIRIDSHKHEAQIFLQNKYTWSTKIFHSINWDSHSSCLISLPNSLKRFSLRFIHHRLPTGNMLFDSPHPCPYCKITFTSSSAHDHF